MTMPDILHCAKCGEPLKIVCDAHGTEWVPDRRIAAVPLEPHATERRKTSAVSRGEVIAAPGTLTEAVLLALTTQPQTAHDVAPVVGRSASLVGVYLAQLASEGRIERVSRGRYVRAA